MTILVNTLTRCAGQGHYTVNVTIGGQTFDVSATLQDMQVDFSTWEEAKQAGIDRLRSAAKEANAVTFAQVRTALEGKTFKI